MKLTFLCFFALVAYALAAFKVSVTSDGGKLKFGGSTRFFDASIKIVDVVEFNDTFDASSIDWANVGGSAGALNSLDGARNWCNSFTYQGDEEFIFDNRNVELENGIAGTATCTRETGGNGFVIARMAQAAEAGEYRTNVNGQEWDVNVAAGEWKIDIIYEWSSTAAPHNYMVIETLVEWDVNEAAFAQSVISSGDVPDIDVDAGDDDCVRLSIEDSAYDYCYPNVPIKFYDATTGSAESPPADNEVDVDGEFTLEIGERDGLNEGSLKIFIIMEAKSGNANVPLPVRGELDPTLNGENAAAALPSWVSWLTL